MQDIVFWYLLKLLAPRSVLETGVSWGTMHILTEFIKIIARPAKCVQLVGKYHTSMM